MTAQEQQEMERRRGFWEGKVSADIQNLSEKIDKYIDLNEKFKADIYVKVNSNTQKITTLKAWAAGFGAGFGALTSLVIGIIKGKA